MRIINKVGLSLIASICFLQGCSLTNVRHEPVSAVNLAEGFVRSAFVHGDFEDALKYANKEQVVLKGKDFEIAMINVQGSAPYPDDIRSIAYEIPFGQRQVIVDLEGTGAGRLSYYRVLVVGDAATKYSVADVRRSDVPFPKGPLQEPVR